MSRKRTELMVGLFLFVGLCLLAGMILKFGNFGDAFRPKYSIELRYASAGGVVKGTEVKFSGVTVGRVSSPPLPNDDYTGTVMQLSIFKEYPIPEGSRISIESAGFLGDSYVAITPPKVPSATYLENGEVVDGAPSIGLNALANSAGDISERGKEIVVDMRAALSELNSALSKLDSSILGEENLALFNETIAGLSEAVENLNSDVLGEENSENLRVSLANFRQISENFVTTSENLIASSEKISPILDTAQGAVEKADEGIGEITSAARNAKVAIKRATEGDGLVAALINDAELRNDFEALISNLRTSGILRYRDTVAEPIDKPRIGERKGIFRNR